MSADKKHFAIAGTGIAGMSAAYILQKHGHDVTVFEANDYIGGHTHTVYVKDEHYGDNLPIDTGFIVFNELTYPNLLKLFKELKVPYQATDMSFAVSSKDGEFEYCGSTLNSLFCQRSNILNPQFYKLIWEINRFNKKSLEVLEDPRFENMSIAEYFSYRKIGDLCFKHYLLPMTSALWSAPFETISKFPILSLIRFFKNHGLLGFTTQFQWQTVKNGSWTYRNLLIEKFKENIHLSSPVLQVKSLDNHKVLVKTPHHELEFDGIVMASHADQSFKALAEPTPLETQLLSPIKYQPNNVILHTDKAVMPIRKLGWAAWNHKDVGARSVVSYWMNILQSLPTKTDYFVSLNAKEVIAPDKVLREFTYDHPIFDQNVLKVQSRLPELNEQGRGIYFCGSYFAYGFHEDALRSSVEMCKKILKVKEVL